MGEQATRRRFTREFKLAAVRQVVGEGRTQKQVAEELGLNANLLGRWIKQLRADPGQAFPGRGNLKARDKEVEDLRREVSRLKGELSFLRKVSGYFSRNQRWNIRGSRRTAAATRRAGCARRWRSPIGASARGSQDALLHRGGQ